MLLDILYLICFWHRLFGYIGGVPFKVERNSNTIVALP